MIKRNLYIRLIFIIVVAVLAFLAAYPSGPDLKVGSYRKPLFIHQGLDLKGGVAVTYEANLSQIAPDKRATALTSLKSLVESRVNTLGVSEPVIQIGKIGGSDTLLVELPGIVNIDEAIKKIGQFPDLKFLDENGQVVITGADVDKASVIFGDPNSSTKTNTSSQSTNILGEPQVQLILKGDAAKKFGDITTQYAAANPQKSIAIVLDGQIISNPVVRGAITDGKPVISGNFTVDTAKDLERQLNEGALPVPIKIIAQQTIGATLGAESLKKSLAAGLIGFLLIALFMILYYRVPGILAVLALLIYTALNIALYKLLPVTVTLAGVAGFILSIGMAVDANILIFERMKEELRDGKDQLRAIDEGFKRAWTSIRDSNFSTLLTALILYIGTTGLIKGFALTLAIGVLISMFTAITVTQVLLKLIVTSGMRKVIHV